VIQLCKIWGIRSINVVRDRLAVQCPSGDVVIVLDLTSPVFFRDDFSKVESELKQLGADYVVSESQLNSSETRSWMQSIGHSLKLGLNCVGGKSALNLARSVGCVLPRLDPAC
jgi:trans-2-enoyl-CoA reductase